MIWEKIKTDIYYSDGSLRDIYVLDSTIEDWKKWIDFINENYQVKFEYFDNQGNKKIESKINFYEVSKYWNNYENSISAEFLVGEVLLKCYFFSIDEIENNFVSSPLPKIDYYKDTFFNTETKLICIGNSIDKESILNKHDTQLDNILNDTFEIIEYV